MRFPIQSALSAASVLCLTSQTLFAQTTITVGFGESLTEQSLTDGIYNGQAFSLAPETTFRILEGGTLEGLLSDQPWWGNLPDYLPNYFDMRGSTVLAEAGADIGPSSAGDTYIGNATVILDGAASTATLWFDNSEVTLNDPQIRAISIGGGSNVDFRSGILGRGAAVYGGSTLTVSHADATLAPNQSTALIEFAQVDLREDARLIVYPGGEVASIDDVHGSTIELRGGRIAEVFFLQSKSTVIVEDGTLESVWNFSDSTMTIRGGSVDLINDSISDGSTLNIHGGTMNSASISASEVVMTGGVVSSTLHLVSQSSAQITGGHIADRVRRPPLIIPGTLFAGEGSYASFGGSASTSFVGASANGVVDVHGGELSGIRLLEGGTLNLTGGRLQPISTRQSLITLFELKTEPGSTFNIFGGEFRLDNQPIAGTLSDSQIGFLTGTLPDGSVFAMPTYNGVAGETIHLIPAQIPPLQLEPIVIDQPSHLTGARPGQSFHVLNGGLFEKPFLAVGANITVSGGTLDSLHAHHSKVTLSDGTIGERLTPHQPVPAHILINSELAMSGGSVKGRLLSWSSSVVEISDGSMRSLQTAERTTTTITGGEVNSLISEGSLLFNEGNVNETLTLMGSTTINGGRFESENEITRGTTNINGGVFNGPTTFSVSENPITIEPTSITNIAGGRFLGTISVEPDAVLNLSVKDFAINDVPVDLQIGQVYTVTDRSAAFRATLADGNVLTIDPTSTEDPDILDDTAVFTVSKVSCAGDTDLDARVGVDDFINVLVNFGKNTSSLFYIDRLAQGDANADGITNVQDFIVVLLQFGRCPES